MSDPGLRRVSLVRGGVASVDTLAVEEPLEIHVEDTPLVVLMRTPGEDLDLTAGFLWTEGVIDGPDDLTALAPCADPNRENAENIVKVRLASGLDRRVVRAQRDMYATAGCGLCGKTTIDELFQRTTPLAARREVADVDGLVAALRVHQPRFAATGGLHGAALFRGDRVLFAREDIGRHNAVDKVLGAALRADDLELTDTTLVVSSRAGFEIVQKALVAQVGAVVAVGAASSLAHELAVRSNLTLYSFARGSGANRHG